MFHSFSPAHKGIILALLGFTSFSFADICAKYLMAQGHSPFQVQMMLMGGSALFALSLSPRLGGLQSLWTSGQRKFHLLRGFLNALIGLTVMYSFSVLSLAAVYTMLFTMPFFASLLSVLFYRQKISFVQAAALLVGFAGVVIAAQPGTEDFDPRLLVALLGSVLIAVMFLISHSLHGASLASLAIGPFAGGALLIAPLGIMHFTPLPPELWGVVTLGAFLGMVGMIAVSLAFRTADAATVSPYTYTEMIWAIIFGYLVFGDVPTLWMMAGAGLIIGSGIFLLYRERTRT